MVGDMFRVTLNYDQSEIPFVRFKNLTCTFTGSYLRAVTGAAAADDDDADNAGHHSTSTGPLGRHIANHWFCL